MALSVNLGFYKPGARVVLMSFISIREIYYLRTNKGIYVLEIPGHIRMCISGQFAGHYVKPYVLYSGTAC